MEGEQRVLVVEEKFARENSLQHHLWNDVNMGPDMKASFVKRWAVKVAEAMEVLNLAGVAHRFLRPENIIMSSNRENAHLKVAAFDTAVIYWDAVNRTTFPLSKGLPLPELSELKKVHLLDHLPPESFTEGYDGSAVDVWSVGVLICRLATGSTPFAKVVSTIVSADNAPSSSEITAKFIEAWKRSKERLWIAEELRSLLDDVFTETDARITLWEMAKDFRLACKDKREYGKKKVPPYYRIDLLKVFNLACMIYNDNLYINLNIEPTEHKCGRPT